MTDSFGIVRVVPDVDRTPLVFQILQAPGQILVVAADVVVEGRHVDAVVLIDMAIDGITVACLCFIFRTPDFQQLRINGQPALHGLPRSIGGVGRLR